MKIYRLIKRHKNSIIEEVTGTNIEAESLKEAIAIIKNMGGQVVDSNNIHKTITIEA